MRLFKSSFFWFVTSASIFLVVSLFFAIRCWNWLQPQAPTTASNSDTLRNVGLLIAGGLTLIFALWRGWVAKCQADTAQKSLLNERYQTGSEMLGNDVLSVRLGGIYALEILARDNLEHYHIDVMNLFCAFVRNPTIDERERASTKELTAVSQPRPDVQQVMTLIGGRSGAGIQLERDIKFKLDLRSADLRRVWLRDANLAGARFDEADLSQATLIGADISDACMWETNLSRVLFAEPPRGDEGISERNPVKGLTQNMLNDAWAYTGAAPQFLGDMVDNESNQPLELLDIRPP